MRRTLTLIADSARAPLDDAAVERASSALRELGAQVDVPDWLAAGEACDLPFHGPPTGDMCAAVRDALEAAPVDIAVQAAAGRRKSILVADMDSTIVTTETLDELAAHAGVKDKVAAITARSMNGELDFEESLRERVAMLAGLPATALGEVASRTVLTPGARTLVVTMRAHGAYTVLVSGGFLYFTSRIRAAAGFDLDIANDLEIVDGRLTGRLAGPIVDRDAKLATLTRLVGERGLTMEDSLAVGDGANDLGMLRAAGLGVGFRARPAVAAAAGARIDHADLSALLYLQGYRREQFQA
jgi:phosphoserine phosphatase